MKVYVATCSTNDPDSDSVLGEYAVEILGVFVDPNIAKQAFIKEEVVESSTGNWIRKHVCFRGDHEVKEFKLNQEGYFQEDK